MWCCDECKVKDIKRGFSKPCAAKIFKYKDDGGICEICGKNEDVFYRPEVKTKKMEEK